MKLKDLKDILNDNIEIYEINDEDNAKIKFLDKGYFCNEDTCLLLSEYQNREIESMWSGLNEYIEPITCIYVHKLK